MAGEKGTRRRSAPSREPWAGKGEGKPVALVTGGARRFGASVSRHLAARGYAVVVNYRSSRREAEALVRRVRERGGTALAVRADVTRPGDVRRMVERVECAFGRLDVLVHNVGDYLQAPVSRVSPEAWGTILDSNLTSFYLCAREVLPLMRRHRRGRIVVIGYAPAGRIVGSSPCAVYHIAKTGALILAKTIAVEEAPHGITVNMISPGTIFNSVKKPSRRAADYIPAGRFCRYADLLGMIDYLLSGQAEYVTGGHFVVSGGYAV